MSHWIVLPVVLPAMLAALIVLVMRHHLLLQRVFSLGGAVGVLALAAGLVWQTADGTIVIYQLGSWAAPFGIVLVADRLSTLFVLLTGLLSVIVLLYAIGSGWDTRGRNFHALFQFQIMGICGAFLTGDAFNLFVFFEVLLIASYGLMIHSGGAQRFRVGVQYVVFNLLGSTLFLFALGTIYAETGTLNMADLAQRLAAMPEENSAGLRVAAVMMLMVFAVKAAILPLHFWLPGAYSQAPAPVAALFAIMTKVGAYAIIRFYTLVFPPDLVLTQGLFDTWLMPAALLTLALGMIGVLGARSFDRLVAFSVIGSMGMLMSAVSVFTPQGIAAALYYAVHSTLATAALFLLVDVVRDRRTGHGVTYEIAPPFPGAPLIAAFFFAAAIAMAGLPPLSGFVGKLLILDASAGDPRAPWVWAVILTSSLVAIVGFARAGSTIFWKAHALPLTVDGKAAPLTVDSEAATVPPPQAMPTPALPVVSIGALLAALVAVTILAGPLQRHLTATANQLFSPQSYISSVLDTPGKTIDYGGYDETPAEDDSDADEETNADSDAGSTQPSQDQ